jgi:glycosyltransferase involved in cell wall biosynthesis
MKNRSISQLIESGFSPQPTVLEVSHPFYRKITPETTQLQPLTYNASSLPEILCITSYPPRECGIATYSQDLIKAMNNKFSNSFTIKVCALESASTYYNLYPKEVKYTLDTSRATGYKTLCQDINLDPDIKIVLVQHEFGFFRKQEKAFLQLLSGINKPIAIVFHTVLPHPNEELKSKIREITAACQSLIVMTHISEGILVNDYDVPKQKITVIPHGTHLVSHVNKNDLKLKYNLSNRKVLTTFGLLSSGKSIETTLEALPAIIDECPEVVFLIIGKTHPEVVKTEGETYRKSLETKVKKHELQKHVIFINQYLALPDLLEYLQLTDIYLFTTNDPNQAVSGTFVYAMSCACPIISTPIPHAKEVLTKETGIIFDFKNSAELAHAVVRLFKNEPQRRSMSSNTLQAIVSTAWENSAVSHAMLFGQIGNGAIKLKYNRPAINFNHMKQMTTPIGIIQFAKNNQPDISTGYTLDDNARALVAICMYLQLTCYEKSIHTIRRYFRFIKNCLQADGSFLNYMDKNMHFTDQNNSTNLDDSNGRAIWALGYMLSIPNLLPAELIKEAEAVFDKAVQHFESVRSPRAMAFAIKGIYYHHTGTKSTKHVKLLTTLADRLAAMYQYEKDDNWNWYESYLTYANSILPEAMLCAWKISGQSEYKNIAIASFDFLLSQIFNDNGIEVISNKHWLHKGEKPGHFGEQPIDVAYTILALEKFYDTLQLESYREKMEIAFNWFLGKNRLHQIIYNPGTGGCYDGLEETHVNLNQGAESTVSYLLARLTMEKYSQE